MLHYYYNWPIAKVVPSSNRIVGFLDIFSFAAITSTLQKSVPLSVHLTASWTHLLLNDRQLLVTLNLMTLLVATSGAWQCHWGYCPAAASTTHIYLGRCPPTPHQWWFFHWAVLREVLLSWFLNNGKALLLESASLYLP